MQQLPSIHLAHQAGRRGETNHDIHPGGILSKVFQTLDRADISYCVLHGYETFPDIVDSDVDCLIDAKISARQLLKLFDENCEDIGAEVVHCRERYMVLAGRRTDGSHCFVTLDVAAHCEVDKVRYFDGNQILATRRRQGDFWIPAASMEFAAYLTKTILRGDIDPKRAKRLSNVYRQDPKGCAKQIAVFWRPESARLLTDAADSANWDEVRLHVNRFGTELRLKGGWSRPFAFIANKVRTWRDRAARFYSPDGISVIFLGPDGAGKSSIISTLASRMRVVFPRYDCRGFAPGILNAFRKGNHNTDTPHALKPRSLWVSVARVGYWFVCNTYSYLNLRAELARSTLLMHDRGFVDILVDQKRYRYGGPIWMLRILWWLAPKPDLVILLDAAPEVLQKRKQEVPLEVTARQRHAYLELVRAMSNGRTVNATAPLSRVADDVTEMMLHHLRSRLARRFELSR